MNDLLAAAKGTGLERLSTQKIVNKLVSMGYSVNVDSIMTILQGNPFVQSADGTQVTLTSDEQQMGTDGMPPEQDQVGTMAQAAAKKDIG